jgi:polynucleotide 5'-kinase involved in rRNA processing
MRKNKKLCNYTQINKDLCGVTELHQLLIYKELLVTCFHKVFDLYQRGRVCIVINTQGYTNGR